MPSAHASRTLAFEPETSVMLRDRKVGPGAAVFVVAEIGINHNGELDLARAMIDAAADTGCDAVKFQKRTPELCVPRHQWSVERDTPWGRMSYLGYRARIELDADAFAALDQHCRERGILWFASCWDEPSVEFIERFAPPCYKAASASLTDLRLLRAMRETGRPLMLSTGMSTMHEIESAVATLGTRDLLIAHSNSTYPSPPEILNLRMIETLREQYPQCPVGYSGHELGITATVAAVALGATFVERHITLDRSMWGTDQQASLEPFELRQLVSAIREVESALGDGIKRRYPSELPALQKLRRVIGNDEVTQPAPLHPGPGKDAAAPAASAPAAANSARWSGQLGPLTDSPRR